MNINTSHAPLIGTIFLWITIGIISRLVIHIPDVTPLTSLCLLAGSVFSNRAALLIMLCTLILSDLLLQFCLHVPAFGAWTFFTYSGWLAITAFGFLSARNSTMKRALVQVIFASFGFWVWTDIGVWISTAMYPHTLVGLEACFVAALPFLRNAVIGSCVWTVILMSGVRFCRHAIPPFVKGRLGGIL